MDSFVFIGERKGLSKKGKSANNTKIGNIDLSRFSNLKGASLSRKIGF